MKYLSLFSGIGGFELGIIKVYEEKQENLLHESINKYSVHNSRNIVTDSFSSIECIGFSEIDKYAIQTYQSHFPEHKNYGDITKINVRELPDFDLLVGGFPCQAFSIAGKRRGFDDTRGTLFFDIARILKEKRPRNFILENVKGLLSHDGGRTFKTIISTLTELGYCVEWQVLNAKNFGVPQNRERVFIVGHLRGISQRKVFPITGTNKKTNGDTEIKQLNNPVHSNDRVYSEQGLAPTLNTMQGGNRQPFIIRGLQGHQNFTNDGVSQTLTSAMGKGGGQTPIIANTLDANYYKGNSATKNRHTPRTQIEENAKIRRLTPLECERLMGYPDNWTEGLSDTQRYKTLGNGIVSNVVKEVVSRLFDNS